MDEYACRRRIGLLASLSEMPAELSQWVRSADNALTVPVLPTDALGPAIDTIFDWGHRICLVVTVVSDGRQAVRLAWLRVESPVAADSAQGSEPSVTAAASLGDALRLLSPDGLSLVQVGGRDDVDRVGLFGVEHVAVVGVGLRAKGRGGLLRARFIHVADCRHFRVLNRLQRAVVRLRTASRANARHPQVH